MSFPEKSVLITIVFAVLAMCLSVSEACAVGMIQGTAQIPSSSSSNQRYPLAQVPPNQQLTAESDVEPSGEQGDDSAEEDEEDDDMFDMDIEELSKVDVSPDPVFEAESLNNEVMSVDGTKSTVGQSPAAVYVLTDEMIRRSGVRTIPDALRLVPGVQVSQLNSQDFSVTIRGFAGTFNNKVLVQIDGRAIYSSTYGGVLWDIHELILEDIDRIEIIRGPGATVWGENAVNGIINIVTKRAEDTIGSIFTTGMGTLDNEFHAFSIGRSLGDYNYRIYGKFSERDSGLIRDPLSVPLGAFPDDGGFLGRVGMRGDYLPTENDRVTTFFDFHRGGDRRVLGQESFFDPSFERHLMTSGGYGMIQWRHEFHEDRDVTVQAFYDRTNRDWVATLEKLDNYELDIKQRRQINPFREQVSGLTYRYSKGRYFGADFSVDAFGGLTILDPHSQLDRLDIQYFGGFIQEKWTLQEDKLFAWLGSKVSWNSLNDVNAQPSARMLYVVNDSSVVWGGISRAVRLPTRFDAGIQLEDADVNAFSVVRTPKDDLISEEVIANELGYRKQVNDNFSWELTGFYNDYADLLQQGPNVSFFGPFLPAPLNDLRADGHAYGAELNGDLKINEYWNLRGGYSYLNLDIDDAPGAPGFFGASLDNDRSPDHMVYLQSFAQMTNRLQWDMTFRYSDRLQNVFLFEYDPVDDTFDLLQGIPSYVQLDTRLNYQINDRLDLSIVGRNLLNSAQPEFGQDDFLSPHNRSFLERSVYLQLSWKTGRVRRKPPQATNPAEQDTTQRESAARTAMRRFDMRH